MYSYTCKPTAMTTHTHTHTDTHTHTTHTHTHAHTHTQHTHTHTQHTHNTHTHNTHTHTTHTHTQHTHNTHTQHTHTHTHSFLIGHPLSSTADPKSKFFIGLLSLTLPHQKHDCPIIDVHIYVSAYRHSTQTPYTHTHIQKHIATDLYMYCNKLLHIHTHNTHTHTHAHKQCTHTHTNSGKHKLHADSHIVLVGPLLKTEPPHGLTEHQLHVVRLQGSAQFQPVQFLLRLQEEKPQSNGGDDGEGRGTGRY